MFGIFDFFTALYTHIIFGIGVIGCIIGFFARIIPTAAPYALLIRVFSAVILGIGLYLEGGLANERDWKEKVAIAEERVRVAERRAEEATEKIKTVYVDRVKTVKDVQVVVQEKLVQAAPTIDGQCKVAPEVIEILNKSAQNKK